MGTMIIKEFSELTKKQKSEARKRFKSPYVGYLYRITQAGKIHYRQKKRRKLTERQKFKKGGRIEAYTMGEALGSKKWP